jgi:DNA-binding CsgD family transcriptional regulator
MIYRDEQATREIVNVLACVAAVCAAAGQPAEAAVLLGAVERYCERAGIHVDVPRDTGETARAALGVTQYEASVHVGRKLPLDKSVERALAIKARTVTTPQPRYPAGLSAREVEVLRLVAQGLTDAEVAERLFLSPRTVSQHLRSVYNKLGVSSRTVATRFAVEHGLV